MRCWTYLRYLKQRRGKRGQRGEGRGEESVNSSSVHQLTYAPEEFYSRRDPAVPGPGVEANVLGRDDLHETVIHNKMAVAIS